MRTRKKRGRKPAAVTFTHKDIMALCFKHAKDLGFPVGNKVFLCIPLKESKRNVEVQIELTEDVEGLT